MEFEFKRSVCGQPTAKFSMEHEVIGRWLTDELSENRPKIKEILLLIQKFEQGSIGYKEIVGLEFQLNMSHNGVEIKVLNLEVDFMDNYNNEPLNESYDERLEDGEFYNKESYAECGLLDLKLVLLSWQEYINE